MIKENNENHILTHYLTPLEAWALSIGCAVGWGAFVMPGTTFLPLAGPVGTALGMTLGMLIMLIIGLNFHFLMNTYPEPGGTLIYTIKAFGYDHGILSAWFLILVYIAIMWANATAIVLITRALFGSIFQFGFHYSVAGYDVFCGEVLLTLAVIVGFGLICMKHKHLAMIIQTFSAIILVLGVFILSLFIVKSSGGIPVFTPHFSPSSENHLLQILHIAMLAPWAFVGFESISNSIQGFKFSPKCSIWIMGAALVTGAMCYIFLAFIASSIYPSEYPNWSSYINDLSSHEGISSLPVFYAVRQQMGDPGLAILGLTVTSAIVTGLIGNYIAASRLIYAMSEDDILPHWFGRLSKNKKSNTPYNAFRFLIIISLFVPFIGRAAIGWIVDINTIGALIAYLYTSAAAFKTAKEMNQPLFKCTGFTGAVISLLLFVYFMVPNVWTVGTLSQESYLMLIIWSIMGLIFFLTILYNDRHNLFGKNAVLWIALIFMIFFTSMMWLRQATGDATKSVLNDLSSYNISELKEHGVDLDSREILETNKYLQSKIDEVNNTVIRNSWLQMAVIVISLIIMFQIYIIIVKRERKTEYQKILAEESSKAKSIFLSNMSHDIRTPMNAIIGYTSLAAKIEDLSPEAREYLDKIENSGNHLLSIINDILDMSRIESGKVELKIDKTDIRDIMKDIYDLFCAQMKTKNLDFKVDTLHLTHSKVMCDSGRLNRILLNLISNAYKYTPEGGKVTVTLSETSFDGENVFYELHVIDNGMGMSEEFAATVFEAYAREKTALNIQGTGLGMAITKSLTELMGGTISVISKQGEGSDFSLSLKFPIVNEEIGDSNSLENTEESDENIFIGMKILLVDDNEINREIAILSLEDYGFEIEAADNGKKAYEIISSSSPGDFKAVLMDVQMPIMNGYEATKAIRAIPDKTLSSIPIIAMTANAFAEDIKEAEEAGMNGHLSKPIDVEKILKELKKYI